MDLVQVEKFNEVYVKVKSEPGIMMELSEHFTFEVPDAKFMPSYRNKYWDGKIRLLNPMTGLIYAGLVRYIEDFCKSRSYKLEYQSDFSCEEFSFKEAKEFILNIKPTMQPRDYQMDAFVHAVRERRSLLLSPTASGKSFIIYLLVRYYARKTLIVVPTTSLVSQLSSDFADYGFNSSKLVHCISGGKDKQSDKPITISTWQSIFKLPKSYFEQFEVVIGDEAHLFQAKSLTSILDKLTDCKYRFGFTGTLDGSNTHKLVLEGLFGPVRKVITTSELIEKKHLADFQIKAIVLTYPDEVRQMIARLDYQAEMDFLVRLEARNKFIKNLALSLEGNTLLLFQFVDKHGKVLQDMVSKEAGNRKVFFVHGKVDGNDREEIRRIVEKETNAIIVASFGTFSTGVNIKNLHNVIFASPSKSRIRNLQSIGRGLRKSDTKTSSTLYDISDDMTWKSKKNYTLLHFIERIKIYNEEKFKYKLYKVHLDIK
jgi:superfamily II DNA or RNA helicase